MMGTRQGRRAVAQSSSASGWAAYFTGIDASRGLLASVVTGAQDGRRADRAPGVAYRLHGIEYDARVDAIAIDVGARASDTPFLRYFVSAPRSIKIEKLSEVTAIEIVDARAERTHIYVYPQSVTLPPEAAGTAMAEVDEAGD